MDEKQMLFAQEEIDKQIAKIDRILEKRGPQGYISMIFWGKKKPGFMECFKFTGYLGERGICNTNLNK